MKKTKDWHKTFFKLWQKVQFDVYTPEMDEAQTNFIYKALKLKKGMSVLDVPCGFGRISHLLAKKGVNVTGLEFNKDVLNFARDKAVEDNLNIDYVEGDMRVIPYRNKFDTAICWFGSFGYFSDEDNIKFVKAVQKSLKKGGKFLIETHSFETLLPIFQPVSEGRYGKLPLKEERYFDHVNSRINCKWTIGNKSQMSSIRIYSYKELAELLSKCGFGKFKSYGTIKGTEFSLGSSRLVFVVEKL